MSTSIKVMNSTQVPLYPQDAESNSTSRPINRSPCSRCKSLRRGCIMPDEQPPCLRCTQAGVDCVLPPTREPRRKWINYVPGQDAIKVLTKIEDATSPRVSSATEGGATVGAFDSREPVLVDPFCSPMSFHSLNNTSRIQIPAPVCQVQTQSPYPYEFTVPKVPSYTPDTHGHPYHADSFPTFQADGTAVAGMNEFCKGYVGPSLNTNHYSTGYPDRPNYGEASPAIPEFEPPSRITSVANFPQDTAEYQIYDLQDLYK